ITRVSLSSARQPRDLHSFPTRRSSDLRPGETTISNHQRQIKKLLGRPANDPGRSCAQHETLCQQSRRSLASAYPPKGTANAPIRSEEHTSELQSLAYLVCRLLLEKKKH